VTRVIWICLGGAVGTGARYAISGLAARQLGPAFPYGTLAVNVLGSFLIGGLMHLGLATDLLTPTQRLTLTSGVMGGFTTYSSFSYETVRLWQDGAYGLGALNVAVTTTVCLGACVLGLAASRWLVGN
jgi:CrcB protein